MADAVIEGKNIRGVVAAETLEDGGVPPKCKASSNRRLPLNPVIRTSAVVEAIEPVAVDPARAKSSRAKSLPKRQVHNGEHSRTNQETA